MSGDSSSSQAPRVPLGGDYWEAEPAAPLWGFADLHAHLMAHLAFGGRAFWGLPYDPDHPGSDGMQYALSSCEPIHGGLINLNPEIGHLASGGWPDFIVWPRFTSLVHQQAYVDWIYRAYQGGLRLITCLAVNNELLASKSAPLLPHDDKSAIAEQVKAMKAMAEHLDSQAGGPSRGWMQIAYTPEEAERIIADNKLAIILGVEVDSLGNWRSVDDLEKACGGDLNRARELIGRELDWLHDLGVRQITPIHLSNNAFGGTAIYMRFLELITIFLSGERWSVEDAWKTGVRYRLDRDGEDVVDELERTAAIAGPRLRAMHRTTLLDHIPGIRDLYDTDEPPRLRGGHANTRGLNQYGHLLLEEMMKRGMILDLDHMSEKATDQALSIAEQHHYPVICSHSWFRDLLFSGEAEFDPETGEEYGTGDVHKVAHEASKRGDQIERIGRLGGVVAPIINQGDVAGLRRCMPDLAGKLPNPCAGSSTSWAQAYLYAAAKMGGRGVALGTDINGAAALPGPRFGSFAAFGASQDSRRKQHRRSEIECQANGVAYLTPIRDYRWYRFEDSGAGGYDEEELNIWQGIAQFEAGFNPAIHQHPEGDHPTYHLRDATDFLKVRYEQRLLDQITQGLWLASQDEAADPAEIADWPRWQRATYLARKGIVEEAGIDLDDADMELAGKVTAILRRWQEMNGNNRPLARSMAGKRRDFDINLDGMAHYGMLPDFLQDICNSGLEPKDLAPLFRSAYDYVEMWKICERMARQI
ncbi:MAG TPA: membrane dipeptidase [Anaerolineales bacterium]|nr:membrane dipeptidase [Anaerolineales bacterium]